MKILHIISGGDTGGAKTHVLSLLDGLKEKQDVHMFCFTESAFTREARERGIPMTVFTRRLGPGLIREMADIIRREGFQIIHCHGAKGNVIGVLLKPHVNVTLVTTVHSDPKLDYLGRPIAGLTFGTANRLALRRMDSYVGVSDSMRELLIGRGFPAEKIYSIYNGVDFANIPQPVPRAEYLRSLGLDWGEEHVIFGIAARISAVKDMTTLVKAFASAAAQNPGIRLLIAGDGEQRQEIEQLARETCPAGTVYFAGWVADVTSFYHALDVNCLTSLSETFPYAITEGARMHCATVATAVGGVPRVVLDEQTGILIQSGDANALTDAMLMLAGDKALREQYGKALYEKVRKEFSVEATVNRQIEIYSAILRRKARAAARKRDGALICGAYGKNNAGDDSVLKVIVGQLREQDPDLPICVMTRRPRQTAALAGTSSVFTFAPFAVNAIMRRTSLFISGGGSLIQDVTSTRSLLFYLSAIRRAKKAGCKVMMYGCGIGPLSREKNRRRAAAVINENVDLVTLRDPDSKTMLESLGVTKPEILVTADPALLQQGDASLVRSYFRSAGIHKQNHYALFVLRPWPGMEKADSAIVETAAYVRQRYGLEPLFFAMEPGKDEPISRRIAEQVGNGCRLLPNPPLPDVTELMMEHMDLVISMRLHALIFAAGHGVPLVGIAYDPKVTGFLDYLGQRNYLTLDDLCAENLKRAVDDALSQQEDNRQNLLRLRELAKKNGDLAKQFI